MEVGFYLKQWLNSGVDETEGLALTNIVPIYKALWIKTRFTRSKQSKFLEHFLSIKGESIHAKKNIEVIELMATLYQEADTLDAPIMRSVLVVLNERLSEGLAMHVAMADMFDTSFVMIMGAASKKSKKQETGIQEKFNRAIKQATNDTIAIAAVRRNTTLKMSVSTAILMGSLIVCNLGSQYYAQVKQDNAKADRFIEIPSLLYSLGDAFVAYAPIAMLLLAAFYFTQHYCIKHYMGEYREVLDTYWPPFILYRFFSGLNIFSGLTLLISYIGYESQEAVDNIYESASKYERHHLRIMKDKLGEGESGTRQLDTGLLTKDLQLTLRMAGQGESSSVRTALQIIDSQGKQSIIKKLTRTSTFFMVVMVMVAVIISIQILATSALLFQASAGL